MSKAGSRIEREQWQHMLETQSTGRVFLTSELLALLPHVGCSSEAASSATIVRHKSSGRMTLKYEVNGTGTVFAKAYYDAMLGRSAYQWLCDFWNNGFGRRSKEQVPEPLGYISLQNIVLMRAAPGAPISDTLLEGSLDEATHCVKASARWLAKFHASSVANLQLAPPCESTEVLKTAALLAKVAAACPQSVPLLLDLVHQWKEVAPKANLPQRLVPLHGQFRPEHIFVQGETVVAIDLDKLRLSDPAKDVARFLHVMRKDCIESAGDLSRVVRLSDEFTRTYEGLAPGNLVNFRYYMALYALKELGKVIKSKRVEDRTKTAAEELYLAEFQQLAQAGCVAPLPA